MSSSLFGFVIPVGHKILTALFTGYYALVPKFILLVMICVTVMTGCHSAERSDGCAPIGDATRVEVRISSHGSASSPDHFIDNAERIHQLIEFANARRKLFQPSLFTMPAPEVTAAFYDQTNFLGAIGAGSNFFFVSCPSSKGMRNATGAEIGEFKRLAGSPR